MISRDDFLLTYPSAWLLWLFVFSLAGVGEYAVRRRVGVLPTPRSIDLPLSVGEYRALAFAAVVGVLHAVLVTHDKKDSAGTTETTIDHEGIVNLHRCELPL